MRKLILLSTVCFNVILFLGCGSYSNTEKEQMIVFTEQLLKLDSANCNESITSVIGYEKCMEIIKFNMFTKNVKLDIDSVWKVEIPSYVRFYPNYKRELGIRYRCSICPILFQSISFFFAQGNDGRLEFDNVIINHPRNLKGPIHGSGEND